MKKMGLVVKFTPHSTEGSFILRVPSLPTYVATFNFKMEKYELEKNAKEVQIITTLLYSVISI